MNTKRIIREELDMIDEGITSGQSIVWHRTRASNLKSIQKNGYIIGERNVFGEGVYACFDFNSQLTKHHKKQYGEIIIECKIKSFNNHIILFPKEAKNIYGDKWRIKDQLFTNGLTKEYIENAIKHFPTTKRVLKDIDKGIYIKKDFRDVYEEGFGTFTGGDCKGIVYYTSFDGKAIVTYNVNNITPLRYTEDEGKTWTPFVNKDVYSRNKMGTETDKLNINDYLKIVKKTPDAITRVDYSKFNKDQIIDLLKAQPQLDTYFDVTKFDLYDLINLVEVQPKFKYLFDKIDFKTLKPFQILGLLRICPEYHDKVDTNKLLGRNIAELIIIRPKLANDLDLDKLSGTDIKNILSIHPNMVERFDLTKLANDEIIWLVSKHSKLKKYFPEETDNSIIGKIKNFFSRKTNETIKEIIREELNRLN